MCKKCDEFTHIDSLISTNWFEAKNNDFFSIQDPHKNTHTHSDQYTQRTE